MSAMLFVQLCVCHRIPCMYCTQWRVSQQERLRSTVVFAGGELRGEGDPPGGGKAGGSWEPRWTRLWVLMSKTSLLNQPSQQHAQTVHESAQDRHLFLRTTDSFLFLRRKTKLEVKKTQFRMQISTIETQAALWASLPERTRELLPVLHSHPQSH